MGLTSIKQKLGNVLNKLKTMGVPFAISEDMLDLNADVLSSNETRFNVESNGKKSGAFKIKFSALPDPEKYAGTADYAKVKDIVAKAEALSQLDFTSGIIEVKGGYVGICGDSWSVEDFKKAQADKNDATILRNKVFFEYASGEKTPSQIKSEYPALIADDRFRKLLEATELVRISERNLKEQEEQNLSYQTVLERTKFDNMDFEEFMTQWHKEYTTSLDTKLGMGVLNRQVKRDDNVKAATKNAAKSVLEKSVEITEEQTQQRMTAEAEKQAAARYRLYAEFDKDIKAIEKDEAKKLRVIEAVKDYINEFIEANPDKIDEMINAPGAFKNDIRVYIAAKIKETAKNKRVGKKIDKHYDVADKIMEIFNSEPEAEPGK